MGASSSAAARGKTSLLYVEETARTVFAPHSRAACAITVAYRSANGSANAGSSATITADAPEVTRDAAILSRLWPITSSAYSPPSCRANVMACNDARFTCWRSCSMTISDSAMLKHFRLQLKFREQLLYRFNARASGALRRTRDRQHSCKRTHTNSQFLAS